MCIIQNRSVHGTVLYILRQKRRYIYISIDKCRLTFCVHYMETFYSRNHSVYVSGLLLCIIRNHSVHIIIPFMEPFRSRGRSVHGTVPYILRQKFTYIYINIDICRRTFGVRYTEPFRIFYVKSTDTFI